MPDHRTPAHRIHFSDLARVPAGSVLAIDGPEGSHAARVKRLRVGETAELFDGLGAVVWGRVTRVETGKRAGVEVEVGEPRRVAPVTPRIEVWCPPPKGDRLETMIDQLSQIGVARWRPLRTARSERDAFRPDKLDRVAVESAKQCGRAWVIEIGDWADLPGALSDPRATLADASGVPGTPATGDTVLLLGPEGGWTPDELGQARTLGRSTARFGPHVMRIETAAVAGAACLLAHTTTPNPQPGGTP